MNKVIVLSVLCITMFGICFSQPKKIVRDDLVISSHVKIEKIDSHCFRFSYLFINDIKSNQSLCGLSIELNDKLIKHGGSLKNIVPPQEKNWGKFPIIMKKMGWATYYDTTGLDFLELPPKSVVKPGESISFSFEAKGLPGIGFFWAEGWAKWMFTQEEEDSLIEIGYTEGSIRALYENFFKGTTIIRHSPPEPFVVTSFLDTLISYKHQSRALGWIDNDGIVNSLDKKLENAKQQLQKGNTTSAKNIIQAFINEVEAQKDKHLTSEAYALLKYNAEYLLEKLGK